MLRDSIPIWSDTRADRQVQAFFEKVDEKQWYRKTGNGLPPAHYPIFKLMWLREHEPDLFRQIHKVLGTKDYINYRLTGVIAADSTSASGSGFYNLHDDRYDESILDAAGLPRKLFPDIVPPTKILGNLTKDAAATLGLSDSITVVAGGVNIVCKALGARNIEPGRIHASLGPSSWICVSSEQPILNDEFRPSTFKHAVPGLYLSAMGAYSSGTALHWIRDNFCRDIVEAAAAKGCSPYEAMIYLASQSSVGANRLLMNPCFAGGSLLDRSPNLRGALLGLDLSHTQADVIRAALEGIAFNLRVILDAFRDIRQLSDRMCIVGGGGMNTFWRQIYADVLGITVEKTRAGSYAACSGAASIASVGNGVIESFDRIDADQLIETATAPIPENIAKYERILAIYKKASDFLSEFGDFWVSTDGEFQTSPVDFD